MNKDREQKDIEFLNNPMEWPGFVCPIKRYVDNKLTCGIVCEGQPTVRVLNMFAGWTPEQFDACEKFTYASFEAMVIDGWMVD